RRTTSSSHSPAPASRVSATWLSTESPFALRLSGSTDAIPPCAHAVFDSSALPLVRTTTLPCFAARRAKESPAIPAPTTKKSEVICGKHEAHPVRGKPKVRQRGLGKYEEIEPPSPPSKRSEDRGASAEL